jgi:membrane associated rhomboid family serine protease
VLPLKDNIPTDRVPVVTLLLIVADVVAQLVADGSPLVGLASALFLWWFGTSVEDATSRPRFLALWLAGAATAAALARALDADAALVALAAAGGTATVLGGYARLYPRARVVSILLVPTAFTLHELPAGVLLGAWVVVEAVFAVTAVSGPFADGGAATLLALAAAVALGLLAAGPLARRHKRIPAPAPSATPAWS